mgnify:FL=1
MSRRAAFFDTLRSAGWEFLLVGTGDMAPFETINSQGRLRTETLARAMALMSYDAVALGDHDLAPGPDFVRDLVGWLGQPILATNYALPDSGASVRTRLVEVRGRKAGLLAFLDPDLAADRASWVPVEPFEAAAPWVDSLRAACDLLVAVAHIGDESKVAELHALYPGIDFFLLAHEGMMPAKLYRLEAAAVMGGGARGRHLGRADLSFGEDGAIRDVQGAYLPVVKGWGRRAWIDVLLDDYYARIKALTMTAGFEEEIRAGLLDPPIAYIGVEACSSCHPAEAAQWASTPHARARETLVQKRSDHDTQCQSCHTTGFGYRTGFATPKSTPDRWNVGCEACHGAGAVHTQDPAQPYGVITEGLCVTCHDAHNSPRFDYASYRPRILHGSPAGE